MKNAAAFRWIGRAIRSSSTPSTSPPSISSWCPVSRMEPISPAAETAKVFGLNRNEVLERGRRDAWNGLLRLVKDIGEAQGSGDRRAVALKIGRPGGCRSVRGHLVKEALRGSVLVPADVAVIVRERPEAWGWAL